MSEFGSPLCGSRSAAGGPNRIVELPALLAAVLVFSGCTVGTVRPAGPVSLSYGGAEGDVVRYELAQTLKGRMALGGMPQLLVVRLRGTVVERVERVAADGRRLVRIEYSFSPPVINGMAFESEEMPGKIETTVFRSPSGEIEQLDAGDRPATGFLDIALRALGLSLPLLPRTEVAPGGEWKHERDIPAPGGGVFRAATSGELLEVEEDRESGVDVAILATTGAVEMIADGGNRDLEKFELDCSGRSRFAVAEGTFLESEQAGMIRMKGRAGDLPVSARVRFTTSLRLSPSP